MKIKLCAILFFVSISFGFSQSIENLMLATRQLYQANYTMDFDAIVLLSYPKIEASIGKDSMLEKLDLRHQNEEFRFRLQLEMVPFQFGPIRKIEEIIGKESLLEKLDLRHQNEEFRLRLQLEMVPFQFGPIRKIEGKSFCVVTFRNPMRYFFENKLSPEKVVEKITWLQEINNTKVVIFEPKRNSFNVKKMSTYLAVFDETTNSQWKFFNLDDPNQKQIFESIFNESVKKELGL